MGYDIGYPDENDSSFIHPPIDQGSTFELPFEITYPAAKLARFVDENGLNATMSGQLMYSLTGTDFFEFTCTDLTLTVDDVITGTLVMDADVTATIAPGVWRWDAELVSGIDGYTDKPLGCGNKAKVKGEATKNAQPN